MIFPAGQECRIKPAVRDRLCWRRTPIEEPDFWDEKGDVIDAILAVALGDK